MKKIEQGIVFSDDIKRILEGNNALDFNYQERGIIIPSNEFIKSLREDFKKDVNEIFENKVTIVSEEEMLDSIYRAIEDVLGRYPHRIIG